MALLDARLERLLLKVDKPARYIGGEFNTTVKPDEQVEVRIALAFPDVYDIGMSYHGFKIFYERLNEIPGYQAERVFAPWDDMEAVMREHGIPLYLLESKRPLGDADLIGFTLQHEMNYTNILNMLDLGRVPVFSCERSDEDPIVIAGGHGAFNPEVLADFIDAFVIGDGEWALIQVIEAVRAAKPNGKDDYDYEHELRESYHYKGDGTVGKRKAVPTFGNADMDMPGPWKLKHDTASPDPAQAQPRPLSPPRPQSPLRPQSPPESAPPFPRREALLLKLAQIPGVYVPRFYDARYNDDGTLGAVTRNREDVPEVIIKTNFDVRDDYGCTRPVVPLMRVVHDRFAIELKRGCMVGCRFCQAGMITRPLRERDPRQIIEIAREGIRNTGYDEISLLSLSSADYSGILELTRALRNELAEENVSVSLPSLRINAFDVDLADEIGSVRKSGFTFAPEAGTARLREVINKAVDEQRFHDTIESVLRKGWRTLKFYFMCGLPTETDDDLQGIVDLTNKAIELGKKHCGNNFQLNISLSPFIPKPQTPFQWHAQPTMEEFDRKYEYVWSRINRRYVSLKKHSVRESVIEGVLSRGDRRVGRAIHRAWQLGCKFDNWHEHLKFDSWSQAFAEVGIDPHFFANRERGKDEVLAWDHIEASLGKRFLWKEKTKSDLVKITEDCSTTHCVGCNVCDFKEVKNLLSVTEDGEYYAPPATATADQKPADPVQRMRLTFTKLASLQFISHLDLVKVMQLIFRRSGLKVAYSQGFNRQPKMQFTPPLPMGFGSRAEILDVCFVECYTTELVLEAISPIRLEGLEWVAAEEAPLRGPAMTTLLDSADYEIVIPASGLETEKVESIISGFRRAESFPVEIQGKNKTSTKDLAKTVSAFEWESRGETLRFSFSVSLKENDYVNPVTVLERILHADLKDHAEAVRTRFQMKPSEALV